MISTLRWLGRITFLLALGLGLAGGFVLWHFDRWKAGRLAVLSAGSKVVETAAGPVEYAEHGTGTPVLILHGAPGGYDQALALGATLGEGFRVIAPSRPGFLRTPLTTGLLFEEQADAMAALLDRLGIDRVAVLGWSTGAQVAARFAARHPARARALVLVSPVTWAYRRDAERDWRRLWPEAALMDLTGDIGSWLAAREVAREVARDPRRVAEAVLVRETTFGPVSRARVAASVAADPAQVAFLRAFVDSLAPLSPRESGTRNDLVLLGSPDPIGLESVTAPTLVIAGGVDLGQPWISPEAFAAKISGARVQWMAGGGHLVWIGPDASAVREQIRRFLREPASPGSTAP